MTDFDIRKLETFLAGRLLAASVSLTPLSVRCAWPVFKALVDNRPPMFVKLADRAAAERTLAFLEVAGRCPFLPRPLMNDLPDFFGYAVLCLEWMNATCVHAEDMTDAQLESFVRGCLLFSDILKKYSGKVRTGEEDSPVRQYGLLDAYAARHPLASRLLKPLLSISDRKRQYGARELVVIHGDFQPQNYGFSGDVFSSVFDFDALTRGLACEDAAYAFTERARRVELSESKRRRLTELFLRMVRRSNWPREEWEIAVNHARLRIAARRLEKHPDSFFVAFDIARRDRPLQRLISALEKEHA